MCLTGSTAEFQETLIRPYISSLSPKCGWEDCRGPPGSPPRSHRFSPQQTMGEIRESQAQKLPKCKCWAGYKNLCSMQKKRNSPCSLFTLQFTRLDSVSTLHWYSLSGWWSKVVVCICVDPVCWIQGFKCRSYWVVTEGFASHETPLMGTKWKCRLVGQSAGNRHGFRLFPWTNPAKKASKRSKPKNFSENSYLLAYPSSTERKIGNHMVMIMIMIMIMTMIWYNIIWYDMIICSCTFPLYSSKSTHLELHFQAVYVHSIFTPLIPLTR